MVFRTAPRSEFSPLLSAAPSQSSLLAPHSHCCSVTQSSLTPCDPMYCRTPGFPVFHHFPELAQTHIHQVNDAIQPSHHLSPPCPLALNLSQHQGLFQTSQLFTSCGQSIGASASVSALPMNFRGASNSLLQDTHLCFHICFGSCPLEAS